MRDPGQIYGFLSFRTDKTAFRTIFSHRSLKYAIMKMPKGKGGESDEETLLAMK